MRSPFARIIIACGAAAVLFSSAVLPVAAQGLGGAQTELDNAATKAYGPSAVVIGQNPEAIAGQIINAFLSIFGIFFLALMVYGGYLWMNARGNEQQVEKAKNLITSAIIGLIIALSGYIITRFVVQGILGATTGEAPAGTAPGAP